MEGTGICAREIKASGCLMREGRVLMPTLSSHTRSALNAIATYMAGQNEAVQYCLQFMADQVMNTSSGLLGGFQAGALPASHVITDTGAEVFKLNADASSAPHGTIALNVHTGHLDATWTVDGATITVSSTVRWITSLPSDKYLFFVGKVTSGFFVLTTTNI